MPKIKGTILMTKGERLLVIANNKYYIVKENGAVGQNIEVDSKCALPMPSYLFAIAAMEEENLEITLNFIQTQWFDK